MSDVVVPEHELRRRRAVMEFAELAAQATTHLITALRSLGEAGVSVDEIVALVFANLPPREADLLECQKPLIPAVYEALFTSNGQMLQDHGDSILGALSISTRVMSAVRSAADGKASPMGKVIGRLFEEAPKLEGGDGKPIEGQAPAIPEVAVMLRNGHQVQGAMSMTPEGAFRVMSPAMMDKKRVMVETFFESADVEAIAVVRQIEMSAGGPSIIVGRT